MSTYATPEENAKAYEKCREMERQREKGWRQTLQGAFESHFASIDCLTDSFDDPSKIFAFSDGGEMAYAIRHYEEIAGSVVEFAKRVNSARKKVARVSRDLLKTFNLILKNGPNREKSISEMAKKGGE